MNAYAIEEDLKKLAHRCIQMVNSEELRIKLIRYYKEGIRIKVKLGLDPTSPDIHLGHTIVLRKMRDFQDLGHEVILIIGDFTALIGDPSGRNITRKPLSREEIEKNAETYRTQVCKILDPDKTKIEFNSTWLRALGSDGFIKLCSKFTVSQILQRDDFTKRMKENQPIFLHELVYPLAQGYDSVMIKADVELGGTDQTFNLLLGRELQREFNQEPQIAITMPILEGTDGTEKMSKSLNNYIGITESPRQIFGKLMSISDPLMFRYYALLTDMEEIEIAKNKKAVEDSIINPRDLKITLAKHIITQFHNQEEADNAESDFLHTFSERKLPEDLPISFNNCEPKKIWLIKLILQEGMAKTQSEARRLIQQGGVYFKIIPDFEIIPVDLSIKEMNKVADEGLEIDISNPLVVLLRVGKKQFRAIKFISHYYHV